jgi:hypothetical protein
VVPEGLRFGSQDHCAASPPTPTQYSLPLPESAPAAARPVSYVAPATPSDNIGGSEHGLCLQHTGSRACGRPVADTFMRWFCIVNVALLCAWLPFPALASLFTWGGRAVEDYAALVPCNPIVCLFLVVLAVHMLPVRAQQAGASNASSRFWQPPPWAHAPWRLVCGPDDGWTPERWAPSLLKRDPRALPALRGRLSDVFGTRVCRHAPASSLTLLSCARLRYAWQGHRFTLAKPLKICSRHVACAACIGPHSFVMQCSMQVVVTAASSRRIACTAVELVLRRSEPVTIPIPAHERAAQLVAAARINRFLDLRGQRVAIDNDTSPAANLRLRFRECMATPNQQVLQQDEGASAHAIERGAGDQEALLPGSQVLAEVHLGSAAAGTSAVPPSGHAVSEVAHERSGQDRLVQAINASLCHAYFSSSGCPDCRANASTQPSPLQTCCALSAAAFAAAQLPPGHPPRELLPEGRVHAPLTLKLSACPGSSIWHGRYAAGPAIASACVNADAAAGLRSRLLAILCASFIASAAVTALAAVVQAYICMLSIPPRWAAACALAAAGTAVDAAGALCLHRSVEWLWPANSATLHLGTDLRLMRGLRTIARWDCDAIVLAKVRQAYATDLTHC